MADREVSARLEVTKGGDVEAFRQAAEDLEGFAGAAAAAEDPVTGFYERMAAAVQAAVEALEAGDLAAQEEAVRGLASAMGELRPPLEQAFEEGRISAEAYAKGLEQVARAQLLVESSTVQIGKTALVAADNMDELERSTTTGFRESQEKASRARAAIDDYRRAMEAAKAAGRDIGEAEIRQLQELERRYDQAIDSVGRYRAAQRQAARDIDAAAAALDREVGSVRDLDDLLVRAVPKWGRYVGAAGAVVGVFGAAYDAGTKLRGALNEISGGAFDRFVQNSGPVVAAAEALAGALDRSRLGAEQTAVQMEILWRRGINPTGLSAEEVAAKILELGRAFTDHNREVNEATREQDKYAKSLGISEEELVKHSETLAGLIERLRRQHDGPLPGETVKLFSQRIRTILDAYVHLGKEAPAAIQALAREWGVLTSAEEEAVARHLRLMEEYLESITGVAKGSVEQLQAQAVALVAAINQIDFDQAKGLRTEAFTRIREQVQALVDQFREAGVLVPEDLARIADKAEVLVYAYERVGTFAFESGQRQSDAAGRVTIKLDEQTGKIQEVTNAYSGVGPAAEEAGGRAAEGVGQVNIVIDEQTGKVKEVTNAYQEAGGAAEEAATQATEGGNRVILVIDEQTGKVKEVVTAYDEAAETAGTFYDEITVKADKSATAVGQAADATREGAQAAGEAAGAISDAARSTEQLADGANSAEGQMADLEARLREINGRIDENADRVSGLESRLEGLGGAWPAAFASAEGAMAGVDGRLDSLISKLATVEQKLLNIQNAGPVAAPGEAVN